ncbi:hypothetical protein [Streptomyces sp. NPDC058657]|uniref:hypothetical protein n=1 Tax=unclassified Streptomyces TaxID=2593676 RepID=UPI00364F6324
MPLLRAFVREGSTATEVVLYARFYKKASLPFATGAGAADRCFTIVCSAVGTSAVTSKVIAHERESSCTVVAEKVSGTE